MQHEAGRLADANGHGMGYCTAHQSTGPWRRRVGVPGPRVARPGPGPSPELGDNCMLVKKYTNRRLYDTEESRYITLEELANICNCTPVAVMLTVPVVENEVVSVDTPELIKALPSSVLPL